MFDLIALQSERLNEQVDAGALFVCVAGQIPYPESALVQYSIEPTLDGVVVTLAWQGLVQEKETL
jgi:hypothetical protein